ncbi:MAG: micrococcal nuclease-like protein [Acidimicrobiia bacterium]
MALPPVMLVGVLRFRRAAVALLAGALSITLLLTGCDLDAPHESRSEPSRSGRSQVGPSSPGAALGVEFTPDPQAPLVPVGLDATVTSVTDGDTVRVRTAAGASERVRLIGIDTPESVDPRQPVECFGREASAQTKALLPAGTRVRLEPDSERRDRYGRLLAYVWRHDDGLFVNAWLVDGGWATPFRVPPNVRYADDFSRLGAAARAADRGLWRACR